jgi:hypothetical protein
VTRTLLEVMNKLKIEFSLGFLSLLILPLPIQLSSSILSSQQFSPSPSQKFSAFSSHFSPKLNTNQIRPILLPSPLNYHFQPSKTAPKSQECLGCPVKKNVRLNNQTQTMIVEFSATIELLLDVS